MNSEYMALPDCIKQYYTEKEYLWLSDEQKVHLLETETEPEAEN